MTTRACRIAAVLAVAACSLLPGTAAAQAPAPPPRDTSAAGPAPPAAPATGLVRGRVVAADTGEPLRRVAVSLRDVRSAQGLLALTDGEGLFAFEAVPPGRYRLKATKARY